MNGLARAIKLAGGQSQLAKKLTELTGHPVSQGTVWCWLNRSKKGVPPEYCILIERIVGGNIKPSDLRPDIFGSPKTKPRTSTGEGAHA